MSVSEFDVLSGSDDRVGVQVEVDFRNEADEVISKVITVTGADADEVETLLTDLGEQVEDMRLVAIKGDVQPADLGFGGEFPTYVEYCVCSDIDWCDHNLPLEPEAAS